MKPQIRIGEITVSECPHGGLWLAREDGEGMQVQNMALEALIQMLEAFWEVHF